MFYIFIAFFAPIFNALASTIESRLSNNVFKHQTTMMFYISMMNWVFLPLCFLFGAPTAPTPTALFCYLGLAMIDVLYLYPLYTSMKVIDNSIVAALFSLGQITIPLMSFLFLGEILNLEQYIGFTIIIMASVALSIKGTRIPKLSRAFYYMVFAFAILIPILTMRSFAEERKMRTEQMLLTAPVTITGMVMGKYLAAFTMFVGTVLASCINFIPLYVIAGEERALASYDQNQVIGPETAEIFGSLIGIILLGAAFIAIGIFISSLTENQLSSAVASIGVILLMVIFSLVNQIGSDAEGTRLISSYAVRAIIDWLSVLSRFSNFGYGIFDFSALLYYLSLAFVFIFLTIRVYEKRRWG